MTIQCAVCCSESVVTADIGLWYYVGFLGVCQSFFAKNLNPCVLCGGRGYYDEVDKTTRCLTCCGIVISTASLGSDGIGDSDCVPSYELWNGLCKENSNE